LTLATFADPDGDLDVARWMTGAEQSVDVRGGRGWVAESPGPDGESVVTVLWREVPGVTGVVQADGGLTTDEVLQVVDRLTGFAPD
jgi:hypothetical protein